LTVNVWAVPAVHVTTFVPFKVMVSSTFVVVVQVGVGMLAAIVPDRRTLVVSILSVK